MIAACVRHIFCPIQNDCSESIPTGQQGQSTEDITMKMQKLLINFAAAILSAGLASPAFADDNPGVPFAAEVDSCIAAINARLDLADANRVRHVVKQRDHAGLAYAFAIETSVFAGDGETRYAAYCVASGDSAPTKFRMSRTTG
jgi:hypothetical protein